MNPLDNRGRFDQVWEAYLITRVQSQEQHDSPGGGSVDGHVLRRGVDPTGNEGNETLKTKTK